MKKKLLAATFFALSLSLTAQTANSQELTARKIADNAVDKDSPAEAVKYVQSEINKLTVPSEKRAAYAFLGSLQEALANYSEAQLSYAKAAGLAAGVAPGMPKKSSERLVLDAVRCALSAGDTDNAENYLNSAVRNSKNADIQATIKLYEQWCLLTKAEKPEDLNESIAIMKAYLSFESTKSIKPSLLLTLWYVTADSTYSSQLTKEFPASMEAGIVNGKVQIYPAPFWYFMPRKNIAQPVAEQNNETSETSTDKAEKPENKSATKPDNSEKPAKYQLGLFRDKNNAQSYVDKLATKGFTAYVHQETKPSGTIYYSVIVDEKKSGTVADELRSAGFECYPIF